MGCQNYLAHDVSRIYRIVDIHSQIPDQPCHGGQSLGMNAILRFFDTYQALGLGIFGQYGKGKEPQGAVRYCVRRELLASDFSNRKRQKLTNVISYNIDAGHGHKLGQPRRYSSDDTAVIAFRLLQPIQRGGKMSSVVGNDRRVSSEAIGSTHSARFEREQPPFLHLSSCGKDCRSGNRIGRAYNRSWRRASRGSLAWAPRPTVLVHDDLSRPVRTLLRRDISCLGESPISNRLVPEFRF